MLCFCGLPARTFETQEVENSNRKKLQEVVAGQTVCSFISAMLVVEMLSVCSQCYP